MVFERLFLRVGLLRSEQGQAVDRHRRIALSLADSHAP
jgi:hypothetical protein